MKKRYFIPLLVALFLCLSGCECQHQWVEAQCLTPRTCSKCGILYRVHQPKLTCSCDEAQTVLRN